MTIPKATLDTLTYFLHRVEKTLPNYTPSHSDKAEATITWLEVLSAVAQVFTSITTKTQEQKPTVIINAPSGHGINTGSNVNVTIQQVDSTSEKKEAKPVEDAKAKKEQAERQAVVIGAVTAFTAAGAATLAFKKLGFSHGNYSETKEIKDRIDELNTQPELKADIQMIADIQLNYDLANRNKYKSYFGSAAILVLAGSAYLLGGIYQKDQLRKIAPILSVAGAAIAFCNFIYHWGNDPRKDREIETLKKLTNQALGLITTLYIPHHTDQSS